MKFCSNCGAPLKPDSPYVCTECGAEQQPGSSKADYVPPKKKARRSSRRLFALGCVAAVLFVLLLAGGTATTFLYNRYNPDDTLRRFGTALMAGDYETLRGMLTSDDLSVTDDGLAALCRAFSAQSDVDALTEDLLARLNGEETGSTAYSAFTLAEDPVFLGYSSYQIHVSSVDLLLSGVTESPGLTVDGTARAGTQTEQGMLYSGFFPGLYTVTASGKTVTGQTLSGSAQDVLLLDASQPVAFHGGVDIYTVTVENCLYDEATIFVDGTAVAQKPSGGTVTIPGVALGSTISMEYTAPHGAKTTASVQFTDPSVTALRFENHATEGGIPAEADLNTLLGTYYSSYLDCINQQDMTPLQASTELNRTRLSETYSTDENKAAAFTFESAAVNYASAVTGEYEGKPSVVVSVLFRYKTTDRTSGEEHAQASYQTCEIVFQDGAWLVNRSVSCSKEQYEAAQRAELS